MRTPRFLLVLLVVVASAVGFMRPAQAVNLTAFTWVVPCNDPDGVATDEFLPEADVNMVTGTYLVTTAGVCHIDVRHHFTATTSTPCNTTTTGPVPCATTTLQNLPGQACWNSLLYATVGACTGPGGPTDAGVHLNDCSTEYGVMVNETCLSLGGAGLVTQNLLAPMRARFLDGPAGAYDDNGGHFVITAVLTPLP